MDFDLEQQARESLGASSAFPLGEPNTAFAQYFIGNSFLAPLAGGVANVSARCSSAPAGAVGTRNGASPRKSFMRATSWTFSPR